MYVGEGRGRKWHVLDQIVSSMNYGKVYVAWQFTCVWGWEREREREREREKHILDRKYNLSRVA